MGRNVDADVGVGSVEIDSDEQQVIASPAQEDILALEMMVDIHQVEEHATVDRLLAASQLQGLLIDMEESLLVVGQLLLGSTA